MPSESNSGGLNSVLVKVLAGALIGAVGWYIVYLTERVDDLEDVITNLRLTVEVLSGGNPFE